MMMSIYSIYDDVDYDGRSSPLKNVETKFFTSRDAGNVHVYQTTCKDVLATTK